MENIFPFLWVTGKCHNFEKEIDAIKNAGINAFCVEARGHEEFLQESWWQDFDEILRLAKKKGMQLWILDDKHYPTGSANDKVAKHPSLKARHFVCDHFDIASDGYGVQLRICPDEEDELLAAFAFPYEKETPCLAKKIDLTKNTGNGWLIAHLPRGNYRFALIYKSQRGSEKENYIDMMNPASVDLLITEVYEKFFKRYAEEFGKTIVGFFSDEPRLCDAYTQLPLVQNTPREHTLGLVGAAYPYLEEFACARKKEELLGLWYETENCEEVRCAFMDGVTKAYAKNFSGRIGAWCKAHGVFYAGHIIEDSGAHFTSCRSAGHYFRSQTGQTLAGIDIVLHQIKPLWTSGKFIAKIFGGRAQTDFFLHTLPALAVSEAWLDENKTGSVCEIFGAFGWGESARDMKWMADCMLVGGINHFIPHAFCPDENNDDCPPHFYENGNNPLYPAFCELMRYTKDILEKTKNRAKPKVGVLYNAEAEWSGKDRERLDGVCRKLCERQIPFLIVPHDKIKTSEVEALLLPNCEYLPPWVESSLREAKSLGVTILAPAEAELDRLKEKYRGKLWTVGKSEGVRILDGETPLIFQMGEETETVFAFDGDGEYCLYDPTCGAKTPVKSPFTVTLRQGETRLLLQGAGMDLRCKNALSTPKNYRLSKGGETVDENATIGNASVRFPDYSGAIEYSYQSQFEKGEYDFTFPAIGGAIELLVDGVRQGIRLAAPARFLRIPMHEESVVTYRFYNTLANERRDPLSDYKGIEAFGLLEHPTVRKIK